MAVKDWSPVPGSNTGILSGLTLDGAVMTPPQIDNAFREMAAQVAAQLGKLGFKGADMVSASTVNLATATGWYLDISGTTTITAFGTVDAGQLFMLRFVSGLTLTHNASSLILPTGADIPAAAGDVAFMMSLGSGNWKCVAYQSASTTLTPVGAILDYAGATAPLRWLLCYGQAVSRTTYSALFAILSTTYGVGDGVTTFNLPDLRGRVVAGQDDMGGTSANRLTGLSGGVNGDTLAAAGGAETHTLDSTQLAGHTHAVIGTTLSGGTHTHSLSSTEVGRDLGPGTGSSAFAAGTHDMQGVVTALSGGAHTHSIATTSQSVDGGSDAAHNNVQPTIILNKIIYAGV